MRCSWPAAFTLPLALAAGCGSTVALRPQVSITQTSRVMPVQVQFEGGVPVDYRLHISNPLDQAVTLLSVEIETVGDSGGYSMKRVRHNFSRSIAARGTASIDIRAWVQPLQVNDSGQVVSPVMLRGTAQFESMGSTIQSAFTANLQQ